MTRTTSFLSVAAIAFLAACASKPILPEGATVVQVSTGYRFTEGPAAGPDGRIYFTDIPNNRIHVYDPQTEKTEVFRENSGAANGLMFDRHGQLYACEGGARRVSVTSDCGCCITPAAESFGGRKFNSPNDLTIDSRGGIYFTDPRYGPRDNMEMSIEGVYYVDKAGNITLVDGELKRPNGIGLSPDGKVLYVADHAAKTILAYEIVGPGQVANKRVLATLDTPGGCDGMTLDSDGHLYLTVPKAVLVICPGSGEVLQTIPMPETPANVCFGGRGSRMLYITAVTSLYKIELNAKGLR